MREVAGHDYDRVPAILGWPLRELLLAYLEVMKAAALEGYRHAQLVFWVQVPNVKKPGKPPTVPRILR